MNGTATAPTLRNEAEVMALFEANTSLAHWQARRYARVEEFDDLLQCALLGLWLSCKTWDPAKTKLSVWAKFHMRNQIHTYLRQAGRLRGSGGGKVLPRLASLDAANVVEKARGKKIHYRIEPFKKVYDEENNATGILKINE